MLSSARFTVFCLSLGIASLQTAVAQTILVKRSAEVTLSSLAQNVFEHHPARQSELARQQQISANTDLSNAVFAGPSSASINHYNDVIGSSDGFQEWEGGVDMPLWLPGQKQQQATLSEKLSAQLPTYQQQLMLEVSEEVRNVIWDVVLAEVNSHQAYQSWQSAQKLEQNVQSRIEDGELAGTDGLLAQTYSLDRHSQYMLAHSKLEFSLVSYQQITGTTILPEIYEEPTSTKPIIDSSHPILASLDDNISTLQTKQALAQYSDAVNSSVSVGIRRERGDSGESFNHSVGLGFNFAFDNDVYHQPAITQASMVLTDAQVARQKVELELNAILLALNHELSIKQQQLTLMTKHNETTQQYVSLQQRAFDFGEIDLIALLNSQKLANDSLNHRQLLEVEIKYITAKINQAAGVIL